MAERDDYGYNGYGRNNASDAYAYQRAPQGSAQQRPAARFATAPAPSPKSAMGITGFVLGIIALLTSAIPIVNNFSFFLALLGIVFAIVGIVAGVRGTRSGKGLSIAALILGIVAVVVVLASQAAYGAAITSATESLKSGAAVTSTSTTAGSSAATATSATSGDAAAQTSDQVVSSDLAIGTAVQLDSGLSVSVDSVRTDLVNYDGSQVTGVTVTYTNNGSSDASFNVYDWKSQDTAGVQSYNAYYSGDEGPALSSGTLAPGGTVSGILFFSGAPAKVLYYSSIIAQSPSASWVVSQ